MVEGLAIGLGGGLVASLTSVVLFFLLLRGSQAQTDRAWSRGDKLATDLDAARAEIEARRADIEELESIERRHEQNERELKRELDAKQSTIRELEARVDAVEKARVNLADALKGNPGLVTAVVSAAFAGLREEVSRAKAAARDATGDPSAGEAGTVHEASTGGNGTT